MAASSWVKPQPPPVPATGDIWAEIIEELVPGPLQECARARRAAGISKYGVPLQRENSRNHLQDALQEALDGMAYSKAANAPVAFRLFVMVAAHLVEEIKKETP